VILRVFRARVIPGEEPGLERFVRDAAMAQALRTPGLLSFQPAVRKTRAGSELIIVSGWSGFEDLTSATRNLDDPMSPDLAPLLADGHAEHYELVIGEARAMPLHRAKLRLTRIPIRANAEAAYYETVRGWAEHLLDETGLVAFTLGRRVVGRQDEIVAVQVWADEAALRDAAGPEIERPMGRLELEKFWAADPAIEHFDALTAVEPRADAPAILLTDDSRRYVHATPAAAALIGRPLARLLTLRVEDLVPAAERAAVPDLFERFVAAGSMAGPYSIARPDGSEVEVRFSARANAPWPGSHASVLAPARDGTSAEETATDEDEPDDLDLDRALVEAGLVARYPSL
jgi:PAS domain-containing protein